MRTFTFGATVADVRIVQVREGWHVICTRCGASPEPFVSEAEAVRVRWTHEHRHTWPRYMTRSRDAGGHVRA